MEKRTKKIKLVEIIVIWFGVTGFLALSLNILFIVGGEVEFTWKDWFMQWFFLTVNIVGVKLIMDYQD